APSFWMLKFAVMYCPSSVMCAVVCGAPSVTVSVPLVGVSCCQLTDVVPEMKGMSTRSMRSGMVKPATKPPKCTESSSRSTPPPENVTAPDVQRAGADRRVARHPAGGHVLVAAFEDRAARRTAGEDVLEAVAQRSAVRRAARFDDLRGARDRAAVGNPE